MHDNLIFIALHRHRNLQWTYFTWPLHLWQFLLNYEMIDCRVFSLYVKCRGPVKKKIRKFWNCAKRTSRDYDIAEMFKWAKHMKINFFYFMLYTFTSEQEYYKTYLYALRCDFSSVRIWKSPLTINELKYFFYKFCLLWHLYNPFHCISGAHFSMYLHVVGLLPVIADTKCVPQFLSE